MKAFTKSLLPAGVLSLAALLASCVTEPSALTGESTSYGYTWSQELALGKQADGDIIREMGLYGDETLQAYVREIGERVLAESSLREPDTPEIYRNLEFTFRVLDSPIVNAFALPGGYVYVTRGLLAYLNNEAQLAVVLGHEITHVAARHASKQALKQQWGQIGLMAGAVIGSELVENPNFAEQFLNVGGNLFQLLNLKYGRDAERESDDYGVDYATKAGYEVSQAAAFFESLKRLSEKSGQQIPSWMSSHPDPGEREGTILRLAREKGTIESGRIGEADYLRRIEGIILGENPRQGFVRDGAFYHPEMRFQFRYPDGWRLSNQASAVYMGDANGQAIVIFSAASETTPEEAASSFLRQSGAQLLSAGSDKINGYDSYLVEASAASNGQPIRIRATFIAYDGNVFSFLAYSRAEVFETARPAFRSIAASFQSVSDRKILSIEPHRLALRTAKQAGSFSDFVSEDLPEGLGPLDMAIINQVGLNQRLEKGSILKLVSR